MNGQIGRPTSADAKTSQGLRRRGPPRRVASVFASVASLRVRTSGRERCGNRGTRQLRWFLARQAEYRRPIRPTIPRKLPRACAPKTRPLLASSTLSSLRGDKQRLREKPTPRVLEDTVFVKEYNPLVNKRRRFFASTRSFGGLWSFFHRVVPRLR